MHLDMPTFEPAADVPEMAAKMTTADLARFSRAAVSNMALKFGERITLTAALKTAGKAAISGGAWALPAMAADEILNKLYTNAGLNHAAAGALDTRFTVIIPRQIHWGRQTHQTDRSHTDRPTTLSVLAETIMSEK